MKLRHSFFVALAIILPSVLNAADKPPTAKEILAKFDRDKNGVLNEQELQQFVLSREPYISLQENGKTSQALFENAVSKEKRKVFNQSDTEGIINAKALRGYLEDNDAAFVKAQTLDNPIRHLFGDNLHIQNTFLNPNEKEAQPARFSWTQNLGNGQSFYNVDGAIRYGFPFPAGSLVPSVEAHISSENKKERNSLAARLALEAILGPAGFIQSSYLSISPVYESDREAKLQTLSGEILWSPSISQLWIGSLSPVVLGMQFRWRPYLGGEYGSVIEDRRPPVAAGALPRSPGEYSRLIAKLHGELLAGSRFVLVADYTFRQGIADDTDSYQYLELSPILYMDNNQFFSVGATYKRGRTTPQFLDSDALTFWLGIKF